jgi:single-stranded DNA-binding protein
VKGHLSSSSYEDKEGVTHNVTQIVADDIEKLSTAKRNIQEQSK